MFLLWHKNSIQSINNILKKNKYFNCEHITRKHLLELKEFTCEKNVAQNLVNYIKHTAIIEEDNNIMRTYIVRFKKTGDIVGFFSLKAGLISFDRPKEIRKDKNHDEIDTYPGVELANFALNSSFIQKHPETKGCGIVIFESFIKPIIKAMSKYIGVKFLYIFALPEGNLIQRYRDYDFKRLKKEDEDNLHNRIKPKYDDNCIFMYQLL